MHVCTHCGQMTNKGKYNQKNRFVCESCKDINETLHVNSCYIENGEVQSTSPFSGYEEKDQRALFIDYAYKLFNNKLNPAAYRLMDRYIKKGYTWLGMLRSLEWFYVIKKNGITKAKNNIGIIPYVYDDAQKFYDYQDYKNRTKLETYIMNSKIITKETIITKEQEDDNKNKIDLNTL